MLVFWLVRLTAHMLQLLPCRDDVAVNPNDTEESIWAFLCEAQLEGPGKAREKMLQVRPGGQPHACSSLWVSHSKAATLHWSPHLGIYRLAWSKLCCHSRRRVVVPATKPAHLQGGCIEGQLCGHQLAGCFPTGCVSAYLQVGRDPRPVMRAAYDCFRTQGCSPETILAAAGPDNGGHATFYALLYVGLWHEAHGQEPEAQAAISKAVATQYAQQSGDYMASLALVHCKRRGWTVVGVSV